jgi:hypothetical protein
MGVKFSRLFFFEKYSNIKFNAELFNADGQTAVVKLLVAFRSFANAPQNSKQLHAALL